MLTQQLGQKLTIKLSFIPSGRGKESVFSKVLIPGVSITPGQTSHYRLDDKHIMYNGFHNFYVCFFFLFDFEVYLGGALRMVLFCFTCFGTFCCHVGLWVFVCLFGGLLLSFLMALLLDGQLFRSPNNTNHTPF